MLNELEQLAAKMVEIIPAAEVRPRIVAALEQGMARTLEEETTATDRA